MANFFVLFGIFEFFKQSNIPIYSFIEKSESAQKLLQTLPSYFLIVTKNLKIMEELEKFNEQLPALKAEVDAINDSVDKISVLAGFIKKILESQNVNEVVLATPFGRDFDLDEYDGENYDDMTMEECIEDYLSRNEGFMWYSSKWLDDYEFDCIQIDYTDFWSLITRIGIVNGELKFTKQDAQSCGDMDGDMYYQSQTAEHGPFNSEGLYQSDWLKPANIPQPDIWFNIIGALLNVPEVWEYNAAYPQLRLLDKV